jgi:hypothetical protein
MEIDYETDSMNYSLNDDRNEQSQRVYTEILEEKIEKYLRSQVRTLFIKLINLFGGIANMKMNSI